VTARLDRLERAGLVTRAPDPSDRRAVLVRLTEREDELDEQSLRAVIATDETCHEPLSQRQRDAVASALERLLVRL
jgi:DNA-binding MarR family transcriptional regulator